MAVALALAFGCPPLPGADAGRQFVDSLTPAQRAAMGLDKLTPAELAALNAAVENYRRSGESAAAKQAAETAVADYRRHEEPKVVAQAVDVAKRQQGAAEAERVEAVIVGEFTGWAGRTVFQLDNGQVWRQVDPDIYYQSPEKDAPVEIYRSKYGSYRLHLKNGAWVTVKRLR